MPRWLNLANTFTLVRLVLTPIVIVAILDKHHLLALVLFFLAAVTDVLDGLAARRLDQRTPTGAYFDPIADKCLMSGVFLALAAAGLAPWWFVGIVLGRDVYILLGALIFLAFTRIRKFPPSMWGKASTFVQIVTVVTWLVRDAFSRSWLNTASEDRLMAVYPGHGLERFALHVARVLMARGDRETIDAPQARE